MTNALVPSAVDPDVSAALQIYERIKPLKESLGIDNLNDGELQVFAYVARFTGLDPFTKQIYAIKRGGRVTHQTGIDGYRSVAERSGQYAGSDEATYEECGCEQDDSPKHHPSVARVIVRRILANGHVVEQPGVARWHELKPAHFKPQNARDYLDSMWWQQPYNQLAKCAEANGLRKAFPRVLGGVYIAEEMQGPGTIEGEYHEVPEKPAPITVADRIAAKRAASEAPAIVVDPANADAARGGVDQEPTAEPSAPTAKPVTQEAPGGPVETPEASTVRDEPSESTPVEVSGATSPGPASADLCGSESPYGDNGTCGLATGHKGLHRQLDESRAVVGSWPDR